MEISNNKLVEFNKLYKKMYKPLTNQAQKYVDVKGIAEEIVQDSFQVVWQKWDDIDCHEFYIRKLVSNRSKDELRKRKTDNNYKFTYIEESEFNPIYLSDALNKVSYNKKTALYLKYYQLKTNQEISKQMDVPIGTVKSLLHRGILDLRDSID